MQPDPRKFHQILGVIYAVLNTIGCIGMIWSFVHERVPNLDACLMLAVLLWAVSLVSARIIAFGLVQPPLGLMRLVHHGGADDFTLVPDRPLSPNSVFHPDFRPDSDKADEDK